MGCTDNSILLAEAHLGSPHIANLEFTMGAIDKDVVTLDVSVDDWGRLGVQVVEAFEQLFAPTPNNLHVWLLQLRHIPKPH